MQGNRKARRKLAKLAMKNGGKYYERLALESVNREIDQSVNARFLNDVGTYTEFILSSIILALNRQDGWEQGSPKYDSLLDDFREIYTQVITCGDPDKFTQQAADICGQELCLEYLDDDWDFRVIGTPIEMYVNGVWRKGTVCENTVEDDSIVTMVTKTGQKFWNEVGSGYFRKPIMH